MISFSFAINCLSILFLLYQMALGYHKGGAAAGKKMVVLLLSILFHYALIPITKMMMPTLSYIRIPNMSILLWESSVYLIVFVLLYFMTTIFAEYIVDEFWMHTVDHRHYYLSFLQRMIGLVLSFINSIILLWFIYHLFYS